MALLGIRFLLSFGASSKSGDSNPGLGFEAVATGIQIAMMKQLAA